MIDRTQDVQQVISTYLKPNQTWMVGGFGRGGVPFTLLEAIASKPVGTFSGLTLIKNDANEPNLGVGVLLQNGSVKHLIATHIGLNPDAVKMMNEKRFTVEFVPQGIFAEKIRAGGSGIPAFLSDIGLGTIVAGGKQEVEFCGKPYLLEKALRGDVALLCADVVDRVGNCWWRGSNRNMNVVMGLACDHVIVEAKKIVEVGEIQPENVHLPHVVVSAVIQAQPRRHINTPGGGIS